ncbi:MAG: 50S ribosomal protein L3 [Deltaproteobacteria bacterium]|nr:50S ribosomal protein L3 [Deltaproteobacteria bacterium]MBI4373981.1 50S ribosomal protein L3 [Deltaproteobacteria bacterium]
MVNGIIARKKGMTQLFKEQGELVPVTVLETGPCQVVQIKTKAREGYDAVQLGWEEVKHSRHLREFPVGSGEGLKVGDRVTAAIFKAGDRIHVTGISKGKGFQGVIKRHGKAGGPASHGSRFHRTTGSIGQRTSPGEVFKNMKLPGHMGRERVTTRNLEVVEVRENLVFLKGSVPGPSEGIVILRPASPASPNRGEPTPRLGGKASNAA